MYLLSLHKDESLDKGTSNGNDVEGIQQMLILKVIEYSATVGRRESSKDKELQKLELGGTLGGSVD